MRFYFLLRYGFYYNAILRGAREVLSLDTDNMYWALARLDRSETQYTSIVEMFAVGEFPMLTLCADQVSMPTAKPSVPSAPSAPLIAPAYTTVSQVDADLPSPTLTTSAVAIDGTVPQAPTIADTGLGLESGTLHQYKRAPKWEEALETFHRDDPEKFKELQDKTHVSRASDKGFDISKLAIPESLTYQPSFREATTRMKKYLPSVASVKQTVMPIANLDPHKIVPICCALIFTIAEASILDFLSYYG